MIDRLALLAAVARAEGVTPAELVGLGRSPRLQRARRVALLALLARFRMSLAEAAQLLQRDRSALSSWFRAAHGDERIRAIQIAAEN